MTSTREVITIGGKRFSLIDLERRTVRQDHFIVAVFRRTGIDKVSPIVDEDPREFLLRIYQRMLASGAACELLSAFLLPEGMDPKEWRPHVAKEVQEHLESANTEVDRQLVNQKAFEVMTGFFKQGLISLLTSLNSSADQSGRGISPNRTEVLSPTKPVSGLRLFGRLRAMISTRRNGSLIGH